MSWQFILVNGPFGGTAEGPVWDGSGLLFTNIPASEILRYDPGSKSSSAFRSETNYANGLTLDGEGRLYACEGDARRVVRMRQPHESGDAAETGHDKAAQGLIELFRHSRITSEYAQTDLSQVFACFDPMIMETGVLG